MRTSKFFNDPCCTPRGGSPRIMLSPAAWPTSSFISTSTSCTPVVKEDLRLLAKGSVLFGKGSDLCCVSCVLVWALCCWNIQPIFGDSKLYVCLLMVQTGVAKPVCSCTGVQSLLLPISRHSVLPVLMMFLFLKKPNQTTTITTKKTPQNKTRNTSPPTTLKSENKLLVTTLISLV